MNNDAFAYGLTGSIKPSMEFSIIRRNNNGNRSSNNKDKSATYLYNNNPLDLTVNINFFNCYFNNNG